MINFNASKEDARLIHDIVARAKVKAAQNNLKIDALELDMDITAVHLNGTPLNLELLLAFEDFDFCHDVFGIRRHIDRETGLLMNCFLPRCAR